MSDLDSFAFVPGQQVQCKTRFEETFKGEVLAFDLNSKILILKSPSSSGTITAHNLHFLVLDSVSHVEILEEPQGDHSNEKLPSIGIKYVKAKQAAALNGRQRLVEAYGNGVSQEGFSLFVTLTKKYDRSSDVIWKDNVKILVLNSVLISPPYREADCQPMNPKSQHESAAAYVKSIVRKHWEDCAKQTQ